jgi:hypothetical protein
MLIKIEDDFKKGFGRIAVKGEIEMKNRLFFLTVLFFCPFGSTIPAPQLFAAGGASLTIGSEGIESNQWSAVIISGNGVRPYHQDDSTVIDLNSYGGAVIRHGGGTGGGQNVMLPITIPALFFGRNVKVGEFHFRYKTHYAAITAVILRRQTGLCDSCFENLYFNNALRQVCVSDEGCRLTINDLNAEIDAEGYLYLTIEISFGQESSWVEIGGLTLWLRHD